MRSNSFFWGKKIRDSPEPKITVGVFGTFCISSQDSSIYLSRRKSQALITLLCANNSLNESRSRLCGLLWSSNSEKSARISLRQELTHIRKKTTIENSPLIGSDKFTIWINHENTFLESQLILAELEKGNVPDQLLSGQFLQEKYLSHLEDIDEDLNVWIAIERNAFERACMESLHQMISMSADTAIHERAATAILGLDPTDELAVRTVMKHAIRQGAMAKSKKVFSLYCQRLREDHNLRPAQSVLHILDPNNNPPPNNKKAASTSSAETSVRPLILAHQIASSDVEHGKKFPVDAIRVSLLGSLARFRDWAVREIKENELSDFSENSTDGRCFELLFNTRGGIDGSTLIITLRDHAYREIIWSDSIPIHLEDAVATHRLTIRKLAAALKLEISAQRLRRTLNQPESDLDQYDRWLQGQQLLLSWDATDEAKAEQLFRSILSKWPSHAPAISSLVEVLNTRHHIFPGVMPDKKRNSEALDLAQKAVRISPQDSRIHLSTAWCHLMAGQFEQAQYSFDLALQINDYDPLTLISSAMGYCFAGDKNRAIAVAEEALLVSAGGEPIHWAYHSCIRFFCDDMEGALEAARRAKGAAHFLGGICTAISGHMDDSNMSSEYSSRFQNHIANNWYSSKKANKQNIREWLVNSFPISQDADREKLNVGLDAAGFR